MNWHEDGDKLMVVDGNNLAMRAIFASTRSDMSVDGVPTGALNIFITMLARYVRDVSPSHLVVAFDHGRSTYRSSIYPAYKASRGDQPKITERTHFGMIREFLGLANIFSARMGGVEADDIIARYALTWGWRTVIISGDKDLFQLLGPLTTQMRPGDTPEKWDVARVERKYGVAPEHLPLVMSMIGDVSDGIPGVKGVGPKTAAKLVVKSGFDLDALVKMDHKNIIGNEQVIRRNVDLIDLRKAAGQLQSLEINAPPPFSPTEPHNVNWGELLSFCQDWKLNRVLGLLTTNLLWKWKD